MNLYKLHSKPEKLLYHDVAFDIIPELVWKRYNPLPKELKKREHILARSSEHAYYYAYFIIQGRFELGEPAIARDAKFAFYYARYVLRAPFKLGEPAIAADEDYRICYNMLMGSMNKTYKRLLTVL